MEKTRTLTPALRDLFTASERVHRDALKHAADAEALKHGAMLRAARRFPIGDAPARHAVRRVQ